MNERSAEEHRDNTITSILRTRSLLIPLSFSITLSLAASSESASKDMEQKTEPLVLATDRTDWRHCYPPYRPAKKEHNKYWEGGHDLYVVYRGRELGIFTSWYVSALVAHLLPSEISTRESANASTTDYIDSFYEVLTSYRVCVDKWQANCRQNLLGKHVCSNAYSILSFRILLPPPLQRSSASRGDPSLLSPSLHRSDTTLTMSSPLVHPLRLTEPPADRENLVSTQVPTQRPSKKPFPEPFSTLSSPPDADCSPSSSKSVIYYSVRVVAHESGADPEIGPEVYTSVYVYLFTSDLVLTLWFI